MSYRIAIRSCVRDGEWVGDECWADVVLSDEAESEAIKAVADGYAWMAPLKVFTPSVAHPVFQALRTYWEEERDFYDEQYHIIVRAPTEQYEVDTGELGSN